MGTSLAKQNTVPPVSLSASASSGKKLRRSQRVTLRIPLIAYSDKGHSHPHPGYNESIFAIRVSAHGGLLELSGPLQVGDRFILRHVNREEETECRVVSVQHKLGRRRAGFEFTSGLVNFWGLTFPPADAKPGVRQREKAEKPACN